MVAPEGDPARSTPSEKHIEVMRCIDDLCVARAASSPPQTTENGPGAAVNANAVLVAAFREWCEGADVTELGDVMNLKRSEPETSPSKGPLTPGRGKSACLIETSPGRSFYALSTTTPLLSRRLRAPRSAQL
jgi:hypothetical protein